MNGHNFAPDPCQSVRIQEFANRHHQKKKKDFLQKTHTHIHIQRNKKEKIFFLLFKLIWRPEKYSWYMAPGKVNVNENFILVNYELIRVIYFE